MGLNPDAKGHMPLSQNVLIVNECDGTPSREKVSRCKQESIARACWDANVSSTRMGNPIGLGDQVNATSFCTSGHLHGNNREVRMRRRHASGGREREGENEERGRSASG